MDKVAAAPFAVVVLFFRVFVQRCTVVVVQRIAVYGEVYRHKVQDHADACLVAGVDELHQLVRRAVPGGGTEKSGVLIAPGTVCRMLAQRHELDVVVAGFFHIVHQFRGDLLIGVPAVGIVWVGAPGTQMHLVDIDGLVPVVATLCQPFLVVKGVAGQVTDDRGVVGTQLHPEPVGVAVVDDVAVGILGSDAVFIHLSRNSLRNGQLIDTAVMYLFHRHRLPLAAFPDQIDGCGIWRKGAEHNALFCDVCAEISMGIKGIAQKKLMNIHGVCSLLYVVSQLYVKFYANT